MGSSDRLVAICLVVGALAGICRAASQAEKQSSLADLPLLSAATLEAPYKLEPGDEIETRLVYNPEFNEHAQIRPDGKISLPGIGEISAAGLTVADLSANAQAQYTFLKRPDLIVQVRAFANRKVFIGGEVQKPGPLTILGPKTVAEAIIESGGMKENARRGAVVLIRRTPAGAPAKYEIPTTWKGDGPKTTNVMLEPYDVVMVTESKISKADRAVDQYIRRLVPILMTGGFTYLFGPGVGIVPGP